MDTNEDIVIVNESTNPSSNEDMTQKKKRNRLKIVLNTIAFLISFLACTIVGSAIYSITTKGIPEVYGYSMLIVQTNSMSPDIKVGDLVITKDYKFKDIKLNDDIIFVNVETGSPVYGQLIVHRVIDIRYEDGQKIAFTTKGTNNATEDVTEVTAENYRGKAIKVSTSAGKFFSTALQSKGTIFILIMVVILGIAALEVKNVLIIRQQARVEKYEADCERIKNELIEEYRKKNQAGDNDDQTG